MFKRIVSVVVVLSFVFTSSVSYGALPGRTLFGTKAHAQRFVESEQNKGISSMLTDPATIAVPRGLGRVVDEFKGSESGMVIHIQDRHADSVAQFNIAEIIKALAKNYNINMLCLEAASGRIDTSFYDRFPDGDIKEKVSRFFVEKGIFTGPEYYKINNRDMLTYGVEDKDSYIRHLAIYSKYQFDKDAIMAYVKAVKNAADNLKFSIYSKPMLAFDNKVSAYDSKLIGMDEYTTYLLQTAKEKGIDTSAYPNISKFSLISEKEKGIDFKKAEEQRVTIIELLGKKLDESDAKELIAKSLDYKLDKISDVAFYAYIDELINKVKDIDREKFKDLFAYVEYLKASKDMDHTVLFDEVDRLQAQAAAGLIENEQQKQLYHISRQLDLLTSLFSLTLSSKQLLELESYNGAFDISTIVNFIRKECEKHNVTLHNTVINTKIDSKHIKNAKEYYKVALQRDHALVNNTIDKLSFSRNRMAILTTGGFHTAGITNKLKEEGISYVVVCPNIGSADSEQLYNDLMIGKLPSIDNILELTKSTLSQILATGNITYKGDDIICTAGDRAISVPRSVYAQIAFASAFISLKDYRELHQTANIDAIRGTFEGHKDLVLDAVVAAIDAAKKAKRPITHTEIVAAVEAYLIHEGTAGVDSIIKALADKGRLNTLSDKQKAALKKALVSDFLKSAKESTPTDAKKEAAEKLADRILSSIKIQYALDPKGEIWFNGHASPRNGGTITIIIDGKGGFEVNIGQAVSTLKYEIGALYLKDHIANIDLVSFHLDDDVVSKLNSLIDKGIRINVGQIVGRDVIQPAEAIKSNSAGEEAYEVARERLAKVREELRALEQTVGPAKTQTETLAEAIAILQARVDEQVAAIQRLKSEIDRENERLDGNKSKGAHGARQKLRQQRRTLEKTVLEDVQAAGGHEPLLGAMEILISSKESRDALAKNLVLTLKEIMDAAKKLDAAEKAQKDNEDIITQETKKIGGNLIVRFFRRIFKPAKVKQATQAIATAISRRSAIRISLLEKQAKFDSLKEKENNLKNAINQTFNRMMSILAYFAKDDPDLYYQAKILLNIPADNMLDKGIIGFASLNQYDQVAREAMKKNYYEINAILGGNLVARLMALGFSYKESTDIATKIVKARKAQAFDGGMIGFRRRLEQAGITDFDTRDRIAKGLLEVGVGYMGFVEEGPEAEKTITVWNRIDAIQQNIRGAVARRDRTARKLRQEEKLLDGLRTDLSGHKKRLADATEALNRTETRVAGLQAERANLNNTLALAKTSARGAKEAQEAAEKAQRRTATAERKLGKAEAKKEEAAGSIADVDIASILKPVNDATLAVQNTTREYDDFAATQLNAQDRWAKEPAEVAKRIEENEQKLGYFWWIRWPFSKNARIIRSQLKTDRELLRDMSTRTTENAPVDKARLNQLDLKQQEAQRVLKEARNYSTARLQAACEDNPIAYFQAKMLLGISGDNTYNGVDLAPFDKIAQQALAANNNASINNIVSEAELAVRLYAAGYRDNAFKIAEAIIRERGYGFGDGQIQFARAIGDKLERYGIDDRGVIQLAEALSKNGGVTFIAGLDGENRAVITREVTEARRTARRTKDEQTRREREAQIAKRTQRALERKLTEISAVPQDLNDARNNADLLKASKRLSEVVEVEGKSSELTDLEIQRTPQIQEDPVVVPTLLISADIITDDFLKDLADVLVTEKGNPRFTVVLEFDIANKQQAKAAQAIRTRLNRMLDRRGVESAKRALAIRLISDELDRLSISRVESDTALPKTRTKLIAELTGAKGLMSNPIIAGKHPAPAGGILSHAVAVQLKADVEGGLELEGLLVTAQEPADMLVTYENSEGNHEIRNVKNVIMLRYMLTVSIEKVIRLIGEPSGWRNALKNLKIDELISILPPVTSKEFIKIYEDFKRTLEAVQKAA